MKTNFKTLLTVLLIGIMLTGFAASIPFTPQGDIELHSRYDILNATNITGSNNSVPTDWVMLKTYPVACVSGAITELGDTVTCTDSWVDATGDDMTGDLNFSYANITNATNINATTFYEGGSLLSAIYCALAGCTMTGDVAMGSNNITGAANVNATTFYQDDNAVIDASTISSQSVNSSGYWDALDSPSDINTADITDDNTYVTVAGDTMTGNLSTSASILMNDNMPIYFGNSNDACIYWNGTALIMEAPCPI